eukprot:6189276-Pleurochrysis_carterae.AAC.1
MAVRVGRAPAKADRFAYEDCTAAIYANVTSTIGYGNRHFHVGRVGQLYLRLVARQRDHEKTALSAYGISPLLPTFLIWVTTGGQVVLHDIHLGQGAVEVEAVVADILSNSSCLCVSTRQEFRQ